MEIIETSTTVRPAANLTPDEKRGLLFDVTCPLEIPIEDFDENWWPLVSNIWTQWNSYKQANGNVRKDFACRLTKYQESSSRQKENVSIEKRRITKTRPSKLCHAKIRVLWLISLEIVRIERYKDSPNHTHTVLDSDRIKRSQAVQILVKNEAVKNYSPPAITVAVREYATELGLGTSVSELKRKEVSNIKYKVRGPMESHLFCNSDLKSDISESISFLIEKGYRVENYHVSHRSTKSTKSTKGIVFAHPTQLEKLQSHGWLTLIDSTHKTNKYDWRLFTLYVRDTYGCWNVGAHFFVSNEDCDTVSEALKIVRSSFCRWIPRYILSDQSSIEAKAIKKAFPGISAGEQECEVILCVVHVIRTWMTKIYEKQTRDVMNAAMHKRTKIGCEKLVQDAINDCPVLTIQNYIKRNFMKNTQQWGLWARQHSPLLLRVTSTNPLESYHSELKRLTSSSHGLIGAVHNTVDVDFKKISEAERAAFEFRTKKISAYSVDNDIIEEIHKFPFPLQRLLVKEACAVMNRIEKGKGTLGLYSLNCHCLFRNRYLLPCKHIFHEHIYGSTKLLTVDVWKAFQGMFEECGYEIYENRESVIEFVQTKQLKEAEDRRLTVVELTERIRDKYWSVEERVILRKQKLLFLC
ncbi:hypothetical protein RhiirA4_510990 [Rhizophagus irregularis]|uniref:ZSWIM1/3 RNaseH-like domain-containing protein n=1 Tax=Rhizophagus irregularis TaxID=588596 RepID=A0A2I1HG23_9GLOM|nr:hypothetical protein RhiirA4_510990 [Rhizophagus irregularis]